MSTATCPTCRTSRPVNKDGVLRKHDCIPALPDGIALPWPQPPLTANQQRRMHPLAQARLKADMLHDARWAIRAAKVTPMVGANVILHWRMADKRRRDGDGAGPTLKVVLDALVKEGVLPDDSWVHVPFSGVRAHPPQPRMPGAMWLQLDDPDGEVA